MTVCREFFFLLEIGEHGLQGSLLELSRFVDPR
jgi:hypothetical protein